MKPTLEKASSALRNGGYYQHTLVSAGTTEGYFTAFKSKNIISLSNTSLLRWTVVSVLKQTISWETLSAVWLVWWRKRTVETSPSAAKHLEEKQKGKQREKKI